MGHRTYTDSQGTEWTVWDVSPHTLRDRRLIIRRMPPPQPRDPERRQTAERREQAERRERPRLDVRPGLEHGWLVFECSAEKRRLVPTPDRWDAGSDAELEALCAAAHPVRRRE